jgi:hypothetical protein
VRRIAGIAALVLAVVALTPAADAQTAEPNIRVTSQRPDGRLKGVSRRLVFSTAQGESRPAKTVRVRNIGDAPLNVSGMEIGGADSEFFNFVNATDAAGFTVQPGAFRDVALTFTPASNVFNRYSATLVTSSDDSNAPEVTTLLKGLHAIAYEEANEPTLFNILSTLGFEPFGLPQTNLNPNIVYEDEVRAPYWRPFNPNYRVGLVPIARYSTVIDSNCCPAGWFERIPEKTKHRLQLFSGGPASTGQNQKLMVLPGTPPSVDPIPAGNNVTTFRPNGDFGLYSGTDMSDNTALSMRFFRARRSDRDTVYPHIWLVTEDQGTGASGPGTVRNFDHQDFVWLLINAVPAP